MQTQLFDTGDILTTGRRGRTIITKTDKGLIVKSQSAYDVPDTVLYFADGNYPPIPQDWTADYNSQTNQFHKWMHELGGHEPDLERYEIIYGSGVKHVEMHKSLLAAKQSASKGLAWGGGGVALYCPDGRVYKREFWQVLNRFGWNPWEEAF